MNWLATELSGKVSVCPAFVEGRTTFREIIEQVAQSKSIVAAHGIGKSFGSVRAVDNISFEVHQQQIFSLLGPNGAGKSTLVRMLIGMLPPDEGKFVWQNRDSHSSETTGSRCGLDRAKIGYLPEDRGLYTSPSQRLSSILPLCVASTVSTRERSLKLGWSDSN